jgi:DNA-binding Lrp family transcriptional regulator
MTPGTLAFVLLSTETGQEQQVLQQLKAIEGVKNAYVVYGLYDVIAEIEGQNQDTVRTIVLSKIRNLEGIKSTLTLVVTPPS